MFCAGNVVPGNRHNCYTFGMDYGEDGVTPRCSDESAPRD